VKIISDNCVERFVVIMVNHRHEHVQHSTTDSLTCYCPQCRRLLAEDHSIEEGEQNESYEFGRIVVGHEYSYSYQMSLLSPSAPLLEVDNPSYYDAITPPPSYGSMLSCFMSDEPPRYQVVTGKRLVS